MEYDKKTAVEMLLKKNILVSPEMLSELETKGVDEIERKFLTKELLKSSIEILFSYNEPSKKRECKDFVAYFNSRFRQLERILAGRPELKNITTISRLKSSKTSMNASIIGMVYDKQVTKNNNLMLTIEDQTGSIRVLISQGKSSIYELAKECVLDEVIAVTGSSKGEFIFANNILLPEVPSQELKKSPEEGYAIFLSDIHVGSKKFLAGDFEKFLKWINGESGNDEQREMAKKVKYIFIIGDVVDGIGIYPNQEDELEITDISEQYRQCAALIKRIPSDKKIIISPGNHDSMRISEPQPPFVGTIFEPLTKLPNVYPVSNPAVVTIDKFEGFRGIDVLLYHGYSFDHYVANVESIRTRGGYDRADLIMKFLLQRRHLSPSHSSTLYLPIPIDNLVISRVPDIFATGHIHRAYASHYKHVTLISSSCWQDKNAFQEKMGHVPQPARVPVVNLKTREIKILKFNTEDDKTITLHEQHLH
ncbi:DNA-directed DNA polymerase II small subunit [Candidatus Woesearchaeota archaeon]|nr:DNA-directed DNA polymerase II small subunit [Candidatus Woesearchaeota archaeon]